MKNHIPFVALLAIVLAATGAMAQTREGKLYAPGAFDRLEVDGSAQVTLSQGEHDQVFVVGDGDAQRAVDIELVSNRLVLRPAGAWKFWSKNRIQVDVQMRRLKELTLSGASDVHVAGPIKTERLTVGISGAGTVRFDDLSAGALKFDISGAGDGQLAGKVGELDLSVSGKGKLLAEQLRAARAEVSISGVGNAHLWVTDDLRVNISGVGRVDYWGRPEVARSTSGLGSVKSLGDKR
jgi:hypothetical protein